MNQRHQIDAPHQRGIMYPCMGDDLVPSLVLLLILLEFSQEQVICNVGGRLMFVFTVTGLIVRTYDDGHFDSGIRVQDSLL